MAAPRVIVVGCDTCDGSEIAIQAAFSLARRMNVERVHLVHVLDRLLSVAYAFPNSQSVEKHQIARVQERLDQIDAEGVEVTREVRWGIPARDIALAADEQKADLIVVSSHGFGAIRRAVLGSVAGSLVRTARVPVLVVGAERQATDFKRVMAAIDLSPVSRKVVKVAESYAADQLKIVSAYEMPLVLSDDILPGALTPEDRKSIQASHREQLEKFGHQVELLEGMPAPSILDAAREQETDLIVVGTSGHNAWERTFLGSTATRVLSSADCPVLVVPYAGET